MPSKALQAYRHLRAIDKDTGLLNVIIETPRGCRNKFKYDEKRALFSLHKILSAGAAFPFDFGFIPGTLGDDGDPVDILVLIDEPVVVGCLVPSRLVGVIEVEQSEGKKAIRNDRLIAVAAASHDHRDIKSLDEINQNLVEEIEHFFVAYNEIEGKMFKPKGRPGPKRANKLVMQGIDYFKNPQKTGEKDKKAQKG